MKKLLVTGILGIIIIAYACHSKTVPVITARTEQPPPPPKPPRPAFAGTDIEAGKIIYSTRCTRCHGMKPVENWNVEEWKTILIAMIPKARLDSIQGVQVTDFVVANAKN